MKAKFDNRKEHILELISNDRIEEVFSILEVSLPKPKISQLTLLRSRYYFLNEEFLNGTISDDSRTLERNKIIKAIIALSTDTPASDSNIQPKQTRGYIYIFILISVLVLILISAFYIFSLKNDEQEYNDLNDSYKNISDIEDLKNESEVNRVSFMPANSYEYEYFVDYESEIVGDFDGDGVKEKMIVLRDSPDYDEDEYISYGGNCIIQVANAKFDLFKIKDCPLIHIQNEGDLNDDLGDEVAIFFSPEIGHYGNIEIYTFTNDTWKRIVAFSTYSGNFVKDRIIKTEEGYFKIIEDMYNKKGRTERVERIITY
ncbi:MAG: hypothetical protein AAGI23_08805 [Bacteroidota bacterium]